MATQTPKRSQRGTNLERTNFEIPELRNLLRTRRLVTVMPADSTKAAAAAAATESPPWKVKKHQNEVLRGRALERSLT
jgi:hypothetical protein